MILLLGLALVLAHGVVIGAPIGQGLGALYPSETLYPSESIYPSEG